MDITATTHVVATTTLQYFSEVENETVRSCPPKNWPALHYTIRNTEIIVFGVIFLLALIGNSCVLLTVWRRGANKTRMHFFILHLAIADLIVVIFQNLHEMLIRINCGFFAPDAICRILKYMEIVGMYGSTYILVCAGFDRYMAIRYPMQSFQLTIKRVHKTIILTWIMSLVFSVPQLVLFERKNGTNGCLMISISPFFVQGYVTWYFMVIMIIPACFLGYLYGMIAVVIVRNMKQKENRTKHAKKIVKKHSSDTDQGFAPRASNTAMISRAKIKTIKMTFVIVITFVLCWAPFYFWQILDVWGCIPNSHPTVNSVLSLLGNLNSCTNPWIYMTFSGNLLSDLKYFFTRRKHTKRSFLSAKTSSGMHSTSKRGQSPTTIVTSIGSDLQHSTRQELLTDDTQC